MDPNAPFLVRRVLLGVFAGCVLLTLLFYGWVHYRTAQYHRHEHTVVRRFATAYAQCVRSGIDAPDCAAEVDSACERDPFWSLERPFAVLPGSASADATGRCTASGTG
jgi:hypothetical protein